jgi:hypothetical protein
MDWPEHETGSPMSCRRLIAWAMAWAGRSLLHLEYTVTKFVRCDFYSSLGLMFNYYYYFFLLILTRVGSYAVMSNKLCWQSKYTVEKLKCTGAKIRFPCGLLNRPIHNIEQDLKGALFGVHWHSRGVLRAPSRWLLQWCDPRSLLRLRSFSHWCHPRSCSLSTSAKNATSGQTWAGP